MIEPPPDRIISSTTAWVPRKVPVRLTSRVWRQRSSSNLRNVFRPATPALFTRTLRRPNRRTVSATADSPLLGLGHVEVQVVRVVAEFSCDRTAFVVEYVADDDLGPFADQ